MACPMGDAKLMPLRVEFDRRQSQHDHQFAAHSCRRREGCVRNTKNGNESQ